MIKNSCNCTTCKYAPDRGIANNLCPITTGDQLGEFPSDAVERITKIVGCMYHPQAREHLMKDVIEELERRKTLYPIPGDAYSIRKIDAFNESIDLIKNGVKKL